MVDYDNSNHIRAVEPQLNICPIGAHSDYQSGRVTGMTMDASVEIVYTPREDNYFQIQSLDFPYKETFLYGHDLEFAVTNVRKYKIT